MNSYHIYKLIEIITFNLFLVFIFLSVQIWLLWRDINKKELKLDTFINEAFFKRNCIYIFSFSLSLIIHEFFEGMAIPNAMIYFEFLELLTIGILVLFTHSWYRVLKTCPHKKFLAQELTAVFSS